MAIKSEIPQVLQDASPEMVESWKKHIREDHLPISYSFTPECRQKLADAFSGFMAQEGIQVIQTQAPNGDIILTRQK